MIDPELTWASVAALPTVAAMGYGFGTFVRSDMELGTVVAHSGGYPGFGSHMRWHPGSGVGVVVLGNRTYFPALKIGDQMLRALVRAEAAPIRRLTPAPALEVARDAVERLLAAWDDELAAATFSMNVDMDEPLDRRRAAFDRLRETHGPLHRSDEPATSDTPLHVEWWLDGASGHGRVRVEITLDPQAVPKLQHMEVTSVPEPGPDLRAAAEALVSAANGEATDMLPLADTADGAAIERDRFLVERAVRPRDARPRDGGGAIERDVPGPRGARSGGSRGHRGRRRAHPHGDVDPAPGQAADLRRALTGRCAVRSKPISRDCGSEHVGIPAERRHEEEVAMAELDTKDRRKLADKGQALPDGSFPIRNKQDLKDAIQSYGRAKDKAEAKRWIKRRARALDAESELPEDW